MEALFIMLGKPMEVLFIMLGTYDGNGIQRSNCLLFIAKPMEAVALRADRYGRRRTSNFIAYPMLSPN